MISVHTVEKELLKQLKMIRNRIPILQKERTYSRMGICAQARSGLYQRLGYHRDVYSIGTYLLTDLFCKWPEYSGMSLFPISISADIHPKDQFREANNKWTGEYGRARIRLLEFMIKDLEMRGV